MTHPQRTQLTVCLSLFVLTLGLAACSRPANQSSVENTGYWTCGMHPSIHSKTPGKCPICGMDLVLVPNRKQKSEAEPAQTRGVVRRFESSEFTIPIRRQQQFGVAYAAVHRRAMRIDVRALGTLGADQGLSFECVSRVDGYVEQLRVTSPGERVEVGQPLMTIYSPDLRAPEQELVNLLKVQESGSVSQESMVQLIDLARRRLEFLNVSPNEIAELERTRQPTDRLLYRSPFNGVVDQAPMKRGMSVKPGDRLLSVFDLSRLWLWASVYESEVGLLKEGQPVQVGFPAFPNWSVEGKIGFIGPSIDPLKRAASVRIDIPNPDGRLRPGMYANVVVQIDAGERLAIPFDSVLPTGSRMLVFVDKGSGKLEPRFVQIGRQFVDPEDHRRERYYEVNSGLQEGERIVSGANFLVDAEAQIQGAIKDWDEPSQSTAETVKVPDAESSTTSGEQSFSPSR